LDDALANPHSKVTPHLLRSDGHPGSRSTSGRVQVRVGDEGIDQDRVEEALQIGEFGRRAMTGQYHGGDGAADRNMDVMQLLTPLPDVLIVGRGLGFVLRRAIGPGRQLLLIAVAGLDGCCSLA
jgi:hypothetical protein